MIFGPAFSYDAPETQYCVEKKEEKCLLFSHFGILHGIVLFTADLLAFLYTKQMIILWNTQIGISSPFKHIGIQEI